MTDTPKTHAKRRKRLLFRACHRGIKEMDVLLGRFAHARLDTLSEADLDAFEALLDVPDRDLYDWIAATVPVPNTHAAPLVEKIRAFNTKANRQAP